MTKDLKYPNFWRKLLNRLNQKRMFRFAKRWFYLLAFLTIFGGYFANDIPLYCQYNGHSQFPIFQKSLSYLGYNTPFNEMTDWDDASFSAKLYPIIPYHSSTIDTDNNRFQSPFGKQKIKSLRYRHWLGTDKIGRDVLAGMISGARISMIVSLLGMGLAAFIGLFLGSFSGFYGNKKLKISVTQFLILSLVAILFGWLFYVLPIYLSKDGLVQNRGLIGVLLLIIFLGIKKILPKSTNEKTWTLPVDTLTMRGLEVFSSIPKMLLVLVISAILPASLLVLAFVIGITHWPSITRFTRSEMMKVQGKEYILSAQMQHIPRHTILFRHALPNAIGPALIVILLGFGGAIMTEAMLSFLGLGLPPDVVSWGKMLADSRTHFSAWWLALFPGFAIFITIYMANRMGELLMEELKVK